ncbi:hypothetical protein HZS_201 [Henneguya salminicola]|nr:hypothetical protein HZS_201 [Henneguya salminicola]
MLFSTYLILLIHYFIFYAQFNAFNIFSTGYIKRLSCIIDSDNLNIDELSFYLKYLSQFIISSFTYFKNIQETIKIPQSLNIFIDNIRNLIPTVIDKIVYNIFPMIESKIDLFFISQQNSAKFDKTVNIYATLGFIVKLLEQHDINKSSQDLILRRIYKNISLILVDKFISMPYINEDGIDWAVSILKGIYKWHAKSMTIPDLNDITEMEEIFEIQKIMNMFSYDIKNQIRSIKTLHMKTIIMILSKGCMGSTTIPKYNNEFIRLVERICEDLVEKNRMKRENFKSYLLKTEQMETDRCIQNQIFNFEINEKILKLITIYSLDKY